MTGNEKSITECSTSGNSSGRNGWAHQRTHCAGEPILSPGERSTDNSSHCICLNDCEHETNGKRSTSIGTCALLSFVKDGKLYQLLRFKPHKELPRVVGDAADLTLTMEGPMRLQSFSGLKEKDSKASEVGFMPCKKQHLGCFSGELAPQSESEIHWQAELFRVHTGNETEMPTYSKVHLQPGKKKRDHCFLTDDDLETWPSFESRLEQIDTTKPHVFVACFHLFECAKTPIINHGTSATTSTQSFSHNPGKTTTDGSQPRTAAAAD
ncbi:hypothetical protein B0T26DRAFT_718092, partial [Lasiosphaeria miniovina]